MQGGSGRKKTAPPRSCSLDLPTHPPTIHTQILICQNLRNNLQHPNEYIRGVTLRLLARLSEEELIEPLVPSMLACLDHRHSYVRRNAVLALAAVARLPRGELLLADAPAAVAELFESEQDAATRRAAFALLSEHAPASATAALLAAGEGVASWPEGLQLAALEHVRSAVRTDSAARTSLLSPVLALIAAPSPASRYDAARTLASLSSAPTALRAAAGALAALVAGSSDNNVRLIVLDRLAALADDGASDVLEDMLPDILRALSSPDRDVRSRALALAKRVVSPRSVDAAVALLKKEVLRATAADATDADAEYRADLVAAVHELAVRFPSVAPGVVGLLMDFLSDGGAAPASGGSSAPLPPAAAATALDVACFVRDMAASVPGLRPLVLARLLEGFSSIRAPRAACAALWTLGEFCAAPGDVAAALETVKAALGPLPIVKEDKKAPSAGGGGGGGDDDDAAPTDAVPTPAPSAAARPRVLADGSYATQSAVAAPDAPPSRAAAAAAAADAALPNLRRFVLSGDALAGPAAAAAMVKLVARLAATPGTAGTPVLHRAAAEAVLCVACLLRAASPGTLPPPAPPGRDADAADRLAECARALGAAAAGDTAALTPWLAGCRAAFDGARAAAAAAEDAAAAATAAATAAAAAQAPDDAIGFTLLEGKGGGRVVGGGGGDQDDVASAAAGGGTAAGRARGTAAAAARVVQLTGLSDPVYAEAAVAVHQYDIVLDVTLVNRTRSTLSNVALELAMMGDLRLTERPRPLALAPGATAVVRATVKVSSTEAGAVFGSIVFDRPAGDRSSSAGGGDDATGVVVLNDVHVDVMDYIAPASVSDTAFRGMWAEFEWENKV